MILHRGTSDSCLDDPYTIAHMTSEHEPGLETTFGQLQLPEPDI